MARTARRFLLYPAVLLSFAPCGLVLWLWASSPWYGRDLQYTTRARTNHAAYAYPDGLHLLRSTNRMLEPPGWKYTGSRWSASDPPPARVKSKFLGSAWGSSTSPARRNRPPIVTSWVMLPYWSAAVLTAAPPAAFWLAARRLAARRRRGKKGLCVRCGYDLTANVSGVCPECGTAVPR